MSSRRKYKSRPDAAMPSNAPAVDAIGVHVPPNAAPEVSIGANDEAKTALSSRVAELEAAEAARHQQVAAMAAAAQQRAAAVPSRVAQWIAQHQAEVSDPRTNARLQAAHFGAIADAVEVGSDAYIERLEHALAQHPHVPEPMPVNGGTPMPSYSPPPARRGAMVSAPVSRSGGAGVGGPAIPGRIHLSAEQREFARASGISDAEYGRQLQRLNERKRRGDYPDVPSR
jgi:hypothetical protein